MKHRVIVLILSLVAILGHCTEPLVYIIDLNDEVDNKMWRCVQRGSAEASAAGADIVLFHINTYGGSVDAADSIRTAIMRLPMTTIAFVDPNAASAGSLITLACDTVYMSPGSSYGASTVVNGSGEPMPDKYQSYMKTIMRATAESHGKIMLPDSSWAWRRDPSVAERFVTVDSVLALTPDEAIRYGYSEGTVSGIDEIISKHAPGHPRIQRFEPSASDTILGFLGSAAVQAVLIMLILGGIYMEMHTGGIGFAGGVAFVAAVLYFLPAIVSGTIAPWVLILFISGLVLLALELFVIPGFGICGIAGIAAILASLVGAMLYDGSWEASIGRDIARAIVVTLSGVILAVAAVWYLTSKHGPKCVRRVSELETELRDSDGYIGVDTYQRHFVGQTATTVTDMRPSGKISIGEHEFDAVSLSGYIEAHRHVKVVKYENAQLYVKHNPDF